MTISTTNPNTEFIQASDSMENHYKKQRRIAEDRLEIARMCIERCITDNKILKELDNKLRAVK